MHTMNSHISPMGYHCMGVGGTSWDLIEYCRSMHGRQQVLLVELWLEGMGPHSAGIETTASPYLGLHFCLDFVACLVDHDQGLSVRQALGHCTAVKSRLCQVAMTRSVRGRCTFRHSNVTDQDQVDCQLAQDDMPGHPQHLHHAL